jgi:hypothetical protein
MGTFARDPAVANETVAADAALDACREWTRAELQEVVRERSARGQTPNAGRCSFVTLPFGV